MYVLLEYNVEIIDDQVILIAQKQELEKLERTKIPDNLEIEARPVVAIIGAGAGKHSFYYKSILRSTLRKFFYYYFRWIYMCRYASSKWISWSYYFIYT